MLISLRKQRYISFVRTICSRYVLDVYILARELTLSIGIVPTCIYLGWQTYLRVEEPTGVLYRDREQSPTTSIN